MTDQRKKILFITPGATSAGGNVFLLRFLQWFKEHRDIPFVTLYGYGGDREEEFNELSVTYKYLSEGEEDSFFKKGVSRFADHYGLARPIIKNRIQRENIGLIYSNTVTNYPMLSLFSDWDVPVITHSHELESLPELLGIDDFKETLKLTGHFISVSQAVEDNLIQNHDVEPEKCSLVHGFIPIEEYADEEKARCRKMLSKELGIPEDAFIVGASGTLNWRKSPALFTQIAKAVYRRSPEANIYFVWVGGAEKGDHTLYQVNFDVEKLDLKERVFFLEHKNHPLPYFAALDVFAMVSREDPFPLVCLETASFDIPVICFADAGGMPEFVEDDCGFVVPYLDIEEFASKILALYESPDLTSTLGKNAGSKIRDKHDILTSAPKIAEIIERKIGGRKWIMDSG